MKKSILAIAIILTLALCGCSNVYDGEMTVTPMPTADIAPSVTAAPNISSDDDGMMTNGSVVSPSPMPSSSVSPSAAPSAGVSPSAGPSASVGTAQ